MQDLMTKINDLIDKEYESVKAGSGTYRELKNGLEKVKKDVAWRDPLVAEYIGRRFREMLDVETGALRIGQKPEAELLRTLQDAKIRGITVDLHIYGNREAKGNV